MWDLDRWEWVGIVLARVTVGLLFLLSGCGKLFDPHKRATMLKTLEDAHIPFARLSAPFVSAVEFCFGTLLLLGALTPIACLMLTANMTVAILTTQIRGIHATKVRDWLADFLYLPEVLYVVILVWLFFSGPGWLSVDHLILSQLFS